MTPVAELVGRWIARADGQIVAEGESMSEALQRALDEGYLEDDLLVEKVSEPGSYIL